MSLPASRPPDAGELLDALRAVREAIDIPNPATVGDGEVSDAILLERVMHAKVFLDRILRRGDAVDVPWSTCYLREQLAKCPATGYRTWAQALAETRARKAVTVSTEGTGQ